MARYSKENFFGLCKQFIKFGIVGVSNTLVSLAIYYIVFFINPEWYMVGSILGFVVSVFNGYCWNRKFVFKETKRFWTPLLKSYMSYGATYVLELGLLYVMVDILGISGVIAPIINIAIAVPVNFILNKLWTFRKCEDEYEEN